MTGEALPFLTSPVVRLDHVAKRLLSGIGLAGSDFARTVRAMDNAGELPAFKTRGQRRIKWASWIKWIDEPPRGERESERDDE